MKLRKFSVGLEGQGLKNIELKSGQVGVITKSKDFLIDCGLGPTKQRFGASI